MANEIDTIVLPHRVYVAGDQTVPRWTFVVVVTNRGRRRLRLVEVARTVNTSSGRYREVQRGHELAGTLYPASGGGSVDDTGATIAPKGAIVVEVRERRRTARPDGVSVRLGLEDRQGQEQSARVRVPLIAQPTLWLQFPLRGKWRVANSRTERHGSGVQYAFDLITAEDWELYKELQERGEIRRDPEVCSSFGQPVFAPADGVVVRAVSHDRDFRQVGGEPTLARRPPRNPERYLGNHVVLDIGGPHVHMVHFMRGSLEVRAGDQVRAGQRLGRTGNSGNTSGPHLHIEVLDGRSDPSCVGSVTEEASGLPFGFRDLIVEQKGRARGVARCVPRRGDIVWTTSEESS